MTNRGDPTGRPAEDTAAVVAGAEPATGERAAAAEEAEPDSDAPVALDQPGLGRLRSIVADHLGRRPKRLRDDALAGASVAVANVPDGMANGLLVGVSPIHGLYATMAGPLVGGLLSSTQLMVITTTAAASLTAGQALLGFAPERRPEALFAMVMLVGVFQLAFAALGLSRYFRFVSYSVTTGLLTGISTLLILSQLPTISGYAAAGDNRVAQTVDLVVNLPFVDLASLAIAGSALAVALVLPRLGLGSVGRLLAVVVPSAAVALFGLESVRVVAEVGQIPRGAPLPSLPDLTAFTPGVITGAASVALVILIQGVGVSQSVPNPDGTRTRVRRDVVAQGAANLASGLIRGLPVGGSLSGTALGVVAGARSRRAAVFAGVWMAVLVLGFPGVVSRVAMPALGALLILAGASSLDGREIRSVWQTGWPSRLAAATTFGAVLFLPIQAAVALGVVLSALLHMNNSAADVSLVELVRRPDGSIEERTPPRRLPSDSTTVVEAYGNLFYAGARTLAELLPRPEGAHHPVVVLRLRGRRDLGATLIEVLTRYADRLHAAGGRLYLAGVSGEAYDQVVRTGKLRLSGPVRAFEASAVRGRSTRAAVTHARLWLVGIEHSADDAAAAEGEPAERRVRGR